MFKKILISLLLTLVMLISTFNVGLGLVTTVYASEPCTTLAECRELQQETRDNIAELIEEGEVVSEYIEKLQVEISELRDEIADLEESISELESEIADVAIEIEDLAEDIDERLDILGGIEYRIEILLEEVSQRMRLTQRMNNTNSLLTVLSEAESISDFVRRARTFNRFASDDMEFMDELVYLVEDQEVLLNELEEQRDQFQEQTDQLEELRGELETEQAHLEEEQIALVERETEMQDRLYELNLTILEEEEMLGVVLEAEEVLERIPPPATMTSSNSPFLAQTPNASGLAHPLPGARVTSEFGPRGGRHHAGIDLVVVGNQSAPVLAAAAGTVTINQWHNSFGWHIVIAHNINGQRVDTLYAHFRYQSSVSVGTVVSQGERIGTKGSTGHSSGPHLHFEVHPGGRAWGNAVDPRNWIRF